MATKKKTTKKPDPTPAPAHENDWRARQRAEGFVVIPEAAVDVGCSKGALYGMLNRGELEERKIGAKMRLVRLEQVREKFGVGNPGTAA